MSADCVSYFKTGVRVHICKDGSARTLGIKIEATFVYNQCIRCRVTELCVYSSLSSVQSWVPLPNGKESFLLTVCTLSCTPVSLRPIAHSKNPNTTTSVIFAGFQVSGAIRISLVSILFRSSLSRPPIRYFKGLLWDIFLQRQFKGVSIVPQQLCISWSSPISKAERGAPLSTIGLKPVPLDWLRRID